MLVIGLTGGIASGKSTAAAYLRSLGAPVIDADAISRALTGPGQPAVQQIAQRLGAELAQPDGALDRKAAAVLVFADEGKRRVLEGVLHPLIRREMEQRLDALRASGAAAAVLDVPLLFESGMQDMADVVWLMVAPPQVQLARVMQRDGLTQQAALARIRAQMSLEEKKRLADVCIDTDQGISSMQDRLRTLWDGVMNNDKTRMETRPGG